MRSPKRGRLGETLVSLGHVTPDAVAEALARQANMPGVKIGKILIDLGVPEETITEVLAKQYGLPWMSIRDRIVPNDLALRVPPEYARRHRMLPIEDRSDSLVVALAEYEDSVRHADCRPRSAPRRHPSSTSKKAGPATERKVAGHTQFGGATVLIRGKVMSRMASLI